MTAFRIFLALMLAILVTYTAIVILNHGVGLVPIFFGDIAEMAWPGQFNLDFMGFLLLSALWVSWRHQFSPMGLCLGLIASVGGIGFLAPYLIFACAQAGDDPKILFLGPERARG